MFLSILLSSVFVLAQEVGVKMDASDVHDDTTISIKKGKVETKNKYELTEGTEDITGDSAPLAKDAQKNWKDACKEWRNEFKELNKDNKIITINCGAMECSTSAMQTQCQSKGKYKVRVKMEE